MQRAAGAAAVGQPGAARLASAARRRRGQQRHLAARVVARYAAGAGPVPPSAAAAPPLPPAQQQAAAQRPPVAPRRRVGVNVPPPTPVAPPGSSTLQSLSAAGFGTGGAAFSPVAAQEQQQQPFTVNVRQAAALASTGEVVLSRSQIMNKEVITRTSGRRLGYVQQMFVDPDTLSVVSLYLRKAASSIGAKNGEEHMRLYSVKQVSDVILVHDENVLMDPPADETLGFYPLVGATVVTQDAQELGKVRDYVFDPDTGAIGTIKYDRLGIPTIPQQLFDCYSISYAEVVALGPTRVIVRAGTGQRAIKQNDGILDNLSSAAGGALSGWVFGGKDGEEKRMAAARGDTSFRSDEGYVQWYEQYGRDSGAEPPGTPEYAAEQREWKRARGQPVAPAPVQQQAPRALPPPQTPTFAQAVQPQQAQQAASYQQAYQQQMFQPQRQAVPAGAAGGGWGAPPPAQQQAAAPPQYQQAYQAPPAQQPYQAPPAQQPQAYQQPPAAAAPSPQQPPAQQQQQYWPPAGQQPPRPAAAAPQPQAPQAAPAAAQPPIPQNGIPIIDRTPLPPDRRRDADGNYGSAPAPGPARQQAPAPQQPPAPQRPAQPQAQPAPQRQPPPPTASASRGGSAAAQRAPQQPARMQQQQQAPVVVPDAVIIPGSVQRPTGGLGSGGVVGGPTRIAEYRQL